MLDAAPTKATRRRKSDAEQFAKEMSCAINAPVPPTFHILSRRKRRRMPI